MSDRPDRRFWPKRLIEIGIAVYGLIFLFILIGRQSIQFSIGPIEIKATTLAKPAAILFGLIFVRFLASLPLKRLGLVLFSLTLSLLAAEAGLRLVNPIIASTPELQRWRDPSPTRGYRLIPDLAGMGAGGYSIRINAHGYRDIERPWAKPPGVRRILGLGDSFTFGMGVELEKTYLKRLEALLLDSGRNVDAINAGVIAYGAWQCLTVLEEDGRRYEPDLVIYFFYLDDIACAPDSESLRRAAEEATTMEHRHATRPRDGLRLVNALRNALTFFGSRFRHLDEAVWLRDVEARRSFLKKAMPDSTAFLCFENQLERMKRVSRSVDAHFMVVVVPDASTLGDPESQEVNRRTAALCNKLDIPVVDPSPLFETHPAPLSLYLLPYDAHTSVAGHDLIARAILEKAAELLDSGPSPASEER
jgi:lysophospholipase L1-like esterase